MTTSADPLTKTAAVALIRAHSWPYSEDNPAPCIHTRLGGIGADWMVDALIATIQQADTRVQWAYSLLRHDLVVVRPGVTDLYVDVHAPERAADCDRCGPGEVTA